MALFKKNKSIKTKKYIDDLQSCKDFISAPPTSMFEPLIQNAISENKTVEEYMKTHNVNTFNEPLDKLIDGDLPFGWVTHNQDIVQQIEKELSTYRMQIHDANGTKEKIDALNAYMKYIRDGKKRYAEYGECAGKYFNEYVCKSAETKGNKEKLKRFKEQLKTK